MTATAQPKAATDAQALDSYLRMLAGPAPGARLLEIRFALRYRDMGRLFIAAHSAPGASRLIRRLAARTDVYVGVCLRTRRAGGRDAIDRSHLAFVEIDTPDALDRLRAFRHPPEHDRLLGQRRARARVLHPVRAGHGARARASQPPPRARPRRRPRLRRRRTHPQAAVLVESQALATRARRADRTRPGATVRPRPARRRTRRPARPTIRQRDDTPQNRPHRDRPAAAGDPSRRIRARAHRHLARPHRQDPLPVPRRPHRQASSSTRTAPGTATAPARPEDPSSTSPPACGGWRPRTAPS